MRFVDANVFVYAVLSPKKTISEHIIQKKDAARQIFLRINEGEKVTTSTVHLSEVANILEDVAEIGFAADFLATIFSRPSITVKTVTPEIYHESVHRAKYHQISVNDALAWILMERTKIDEIYTFDRHFNQLDLRIIQE
jgi:uncharacterized protein